MEKSERSDEGKFPDFSDASMETQAFFRQRVTRRNYHIDQVTVALERAARVESTTVLTYTYRNADNGVATGYAVEEKLLAETDSCVLIGRRLRPLFEVAVSADASEAAVSLLTAGALLYEFPSYPRSVANGLRLNTLYLVMQRGERLPGARAEARLGPRGGTLLDAGLRSRGLGKFLLANVLMDGIGIDPDAHLLDGWFAPADDEDLLHRERHRRFFRSQGIAVEHYGSDLEGRFSLDRLGNATPNFDGCALQEIHWSGLERELSQLYLEIARLSRVVLAKRSRFQRPINNDSLPTHRLPDHCAPHRLYAEQGASALARHCFWVFSVLRKLWRDNRNLDGHLAEGKHIPWHQRLAGEIDSIKKNGDEKNRS